MAAVWHGDHPYCLVIWENGAAPFLIDLDKPGWLTEHADLIRAPGRWILARKTDSTPVLEMLVAEGDEPYYVTKGHGVMVPPALVADLDIEAEVLHTETHSYGIGKVRPDGQIDRLWVLSNGIVAAGDDVETLGDELARAKLNGIIRRARSGNQNDQGQAKGGGSQDGRAVRDERELDAAPGDVAVS